MSIEKVAPAVWRRALVGGNVGTLERDTRRKPPTRIIARGGAMTSDGTVYLLHFDRPIGDLDNPRGQARHYLGFTHDLAQRLDAHRNGNGSAIMAAVSRAGVGWELARTWDGDRGLERRLKNRHNGPRLCPICRGTR